MKKISFLGLIFCSLLAAVKTNGQSFGKDGEPVIQSNPDHSAFYAYTENNIVIMRWGTGNEREVDHYVTEHSTDGVHFDPMHQVVAKGAIDEDSSYEDADAFPGSPVNFYRLTTVTKDGTAISSPAVQVEVDPGRTPALVPTVLHSGETLRMDKNYRDKLMIVEFFTTGGQMMRSYQVNSSSFNINTTGWGKGLYFYRISDEGRPLVDAGKILVE
jgi:hypothetical protein